MRTTEVFHRCTEPFAAVTAPTFDTGPFFAFINFVLIVGALR
jgi:hypothetical protein